MVPSSELLRGFSTSLYSHDAVIQLYSHSPISAYSAGRVAHIVLPQYGFYMLDEWVQGCSVMRRVLGYMFIYRTCLKALAGN